MSNRVLHTTLDVRLKGLDEESRTASFVASTERAVMTWAGPEVLRMKGAKLKRFRKNPVVLDSHNRYSLDSVIGKGDVSVEGRELLVSITYAPGARGDHAWELVKGGFVRAVSIGYQVNRAKVRKIEAGEFDGTGEARIEGPALIVNDWELLEVSNVPIPADEEAVRRSIYDALPAYQEDSMDFEQAMGERAALTPEPTKPAAPAVVTAAPATITAPAPDAARAAEPLTREIVRREVMAICPPSLASVAERCLLEGKSFEETRAVLLAEHAKRYQPIGTPEPAPVTKAVEEKRAALPSDDVLVRSLTGMRS